MSDAGRRDDGRRPAIALGPRQARRRRDRVLARSAHRLPVEADPSRHGPASGAHRGLAERTKAFDPKGLPKELRIAIDSMPLEGAGRVEDTFNLLAHAARRVISAAAAVRQRRAEDIAREAGAPMLAESSIKEALDLEWSELQHRLRKLIATHKGLHSLRERVAVEHRLAHLGRKQGWRARYLGVRKNLYDARRAGDSNRLSLESTDRFEIAANRASRPRSDDPRSDVIIRVRLCDDRVGVIGSGRGTQAVDSEHASRLGAVGRAQRKAFHQIGLRDRHAPKINSVPCRRGPVLRAPHSCRIPSRSLEDGVARCRRAPTGPPPRAPGACCRLITGDSNRLSL